MINSLGLYISLQNACWTLSQFFIFHRVWEKLSNLWSSHSCKMHWFKEFLLMPLPTQNSPPSSYHHALPRRKLLILPDNILSKILRFSRCSSKSLNVKRENKSLDHEACSPSWKKTKEGYWRNKWNIVHNDNFSTWNHVQRKTYQVFVNAAVLPATRTKNMQTLCL